MIMFSIKMFLKKKCWLTVELLKPRRPLTLQPTHQKRTPLYNRITNIHITLTSLEMVGHLPHFQNLENTTLMLNTDIRFLMEKYNQQSLSLLVKYISTG